MRTYSRVTTTHWTESVRFDITYQLESGDVERACQLVHGDVLSSGAIVLSVEPARIGTPRMRPSGAEAQPYDKPLAEIIDAYNATQERN